MRSIRNSSKRSCVQERNGKPPEAQPKETPLDAAPALAFPTAFPIKIMGRREGGFTKNVIGILLRHAPDFMPGTIETRPSRAGKYISLTAKVVAAGTLYLGTYAA